MQNVVRTVILALLGSLLVGLAIGTVIRLRLEAPHPGYFIGAVDRPEASAAARAPGHVGDAGPVVLDPGHHEEQVG